MTIDQQKQSWYNVPGHLSQMCRTSQGQGQLLLYLSVALFALMCGAFYSRFVLNPPQVTADEHRMGWNEEAAKIEAPILAAKTPRLQITDSKGNVLDGSGMFVELYRYSKVANGGKHVPPFLQETGDCCSMGWSRAMIELQGYQIVHEKRSDEVLKIPFPPYNYGYGRVQIGKRQIRGQGSTGAYSAQAGVIGGVLTAEEAERQGYRYKGQLADQWGNNGPPKECINFAKEFRVQSVSHVRSWEDCRDAIAYGYPVTVASNQGFQGNFSYQRDGKLWLKPNGSWSHQMCFTAVEDRPGKQKGCFCQNSWGPDAHPKPLNDEPLGGFWVDYQTVHKMVAQGDSWAHSMFDGFKASESAEWDAFKIETEQTGTEEEKAAVAAAESPNDQPTLVEVRKSWDLPIGCALGCLGLVTGVCGLRRRYGSASQSVSA